MQLQYINICLYIKNMSNITAHEESLHDSEDDISLTSHFQSIDKSVFNIVQHLVVDLSNEFTIARSEKNWPAFRALAHMSAQ